MRILVCVKRVPLTGGRIVLTEDEQAIETRHLGFTISPHEECGVEEAVRLVEQHGGEVTVLTLGPAEAEEQIRETLAIGADRGILLASDGAEWDPQATASAILAVVEAERAAGGEYDLIVFGNESADSGNFQVGIRVAHALGRPVVTGLKGLSVEDGRARCEQEVPGGRDVYLVPLPAVVTVLEGINLPRYPSVPAKLRARQKPIEKSEPAAARAEAREAAAGAPARPGQAGGGARPGRRCGARRGGRHARAGGRLMVLCLVEHESGGVDELSLQALALARELAAGRAAARAARRPRRRSGRGRRWAPTVWRALTWPRTSGSPPTPRGRGRGACSTWSTA